MYKKALKGQRRMVENDSNAKVAQIILYHNQLMQRTISECTTFQNLKQIRESIKET